jgi:uncharacterized membrane protein YgcG
MKNRLTVVALTLSIILGWSSGVCRADHRERILEFHSLITIHADRSVVVRETIRVESAGERIRRGIFRTFPTGYRDRFGNRVKVGFEVLEVLRDGRRETYHIETGWREVKVYIGQEDVFLEPGKYTYTLAYRTDRQIGFFDDFDELYWNVTGNEWDFTIEKASAEVVLPGRARILDTAAYTGPRGSRGRDFTISRTEERRVTIRATRALEPGEGLTIAVSWPKGIIPEPTWRERTGYLLKDNTSALAALMGLLIVLLYYGMAWMMVGVDPPRGILVPQFAPPEGYSPAAARYVMGMGYSDRVFAAALVNMAVKGYLTIEEKDKVYTLRRTGTDESALSGGERKIARKLFSGGSSIEMKQENHGKIGGAIKALKKSLEADFEKINFRLNTKWLIPGMVLTLGVFAAMVITARIKGQAAFMALWLSLWSIGVFFLGMVVIRAWKAVMAAGRGTGWLQALGALFITGFALPFFIGEVVGIVGFAQATSPAAAAIFLMIVTAGFLFQRLLKAPTVQGRKVMDRIEGLKMYLETAEQDRLERLNPPDRTPELFEKFLPYALALGVENSWSEQFAEVLSSSASGDGEYRPVWYTGGDTRSFSPGAMASDLGSSFSSAISSSATAPGSSSGSGGGGSSGGGGGGGGGGGW